MLKGKTLKKGTGALLVLAIAVAFCWVDVQGAAETPVPETPIPETQARADAIAIETLAAFGDLEESAVTFFHDQHTEALAEMGKDCSSCHQAQEEDGPLSLKFNRLEDISYDLVKEAYHDGCITCHEDLADQGVEAGPMSGQCRDCHSAAAVESSWRPVTVDRELHYRHAAAYADQDKPCAACHHDYNAETEAVEPVADPLLVQGSCSFCHEQETVFQPGESPEEIRSLRLAAHQGCLTCHRDLVEREQGTGPVTCAGCHDESGQLLIAANNAAETQGADLRMQRGQPDLLLVQTGIDTEAQGEDVWQTMPPVPFDHKLHEETVGSCAQCHHQELKSCSDSCHEVAAADSEQGGGVQLFDAMHDPDSGRSCVGCHAVSQQDALCAGCHARMNQSLPMDDPASCLTCHVSQEEAAPAAGEGAEGGEPAAMAPVTAVDRMDMTPESPTDHPADPAAAALMDARAATNGLYALDDIPETVKIGSLADQYQATELPHREIVLALQSRIAEHDMASAFHGAQGTLCRSCHHNSPASATPPQCANCHGEVANQASGAPGLRAAYHQQCMSCHEAMGIDREEGARAFGLDEPVPAATNCEGCHKAK